VSELREEYEGQVVFTIVQPEVTTASGEPQVYELGTHGLVGLDAEGQSVATVPGHNFGREEIVEVIEKLLAAS